MARRTVKASRTVVEAAESSEKSTARQHAMELLKRLDRRSAGFIRFRKWVEVAACGGISANSFRALAGDLLRFERFCRRSSFAYFPSTPKAVIAFIRELVGAGKRPATIRRHLASIAKAHRIGRFTNPCDDELVTVTMSKASRDLHGDRQRQSAPLLWTHVEALFSRDPSELRDLRDRAMVLVAYDARCRSEELVALDCRHLNVDDDGSGTVLIQRSKSDQAGAGAEAYLAPQTVRALITWLREAHIQRGAMFRVVRGKTRLAERLRAPAVATVFQRIGLQIGLSPEHARRLTGHAARVGATQDSLAAGIDEGSIKQAGRWRDARMVQRYGGRLLAKRGAAARLAELQGRTALPRNS